MDGSFNLGLLHYQHRVGLHQAMIFFAFE